MAAEVDDRPAAGLPTPLKQIAEWNPLSAVAGAMRELFHNPSPVVSEAWPLVHPIAAEDNAIALIRFESGAMGQFEVSWTFRGGMDLRDEVAGTNGTIWLNHFLRTGFDAFSSGAGGYVAEKAESASSTGSHCRDAADR